MNEIDGIALLTLVQDLAEFKDIVPHAGLRLKVKRLIQQHQQLEQDSDTCSFEVVIKVTMLGSSIFYSCIYTYSYSLQLCQKHIVPYGLVIMMHMSC